MYVSESYSPLYIHRVAPLINSYGRAWQCVVLGALYGKISRNGLRKQIVRPLSLSLSPHRERIVAENLASSSHNLLVETVLFERHRCTGHHHNDTRAREEKNKRIVAMI